MTRKVRVALFDKDLKVEIKKYPLTSDGAKIDITQGGKAHFKPHIGTTNYLDMPYRSALTPWKFSYVRTYFAMKWAKKVVDFHTGEVHGPDPEEVMTAAGNKILESKGKQKTETSPILILILVVVVLILLNVWGG